METRGDIRDLPALVIHGEIIFEYQLRNRHDFIAVVLQTAQNIRQSRRGVDRRVVEQDNAARPDL